MTDTVKKRNWFQRLFAVRGMGQVITVFFGLIVLCLVFYLINPNFLSQRNVANLLLPKSRASTTPTPTTPRRSCWPPTARTPRWPPSSSTPRKA